MRDNSGHAQLDRTSASDETGADLARRPGA